MEVPQANELTLASWWSLAVADKAATTSQQQQHY